MSVEAATEFALTAQLIDARTGLHLSCRVLSSTKCGDVLEFEDEITHAIVDALKVELAGSAAVALAQGDPRANDLYFHGTLFFQQEWRAYGYAKR